MPGLPAAHRRRVAVMAPSARPLTAIALLGLVMAVIQATLLRETLEAAHGSELSLALALTLWLLGVAAGAALGALVPVCLARTALTAAAALALAAPFAALLSARAATHLCHLVPGELLTLAQQIGIGTLTLGPVCLLIGVMFTLACRLPGVPPRVVYLAEAVGWLLGGAAATWLFVTLSPFTIFSILAYLTAAAALLLWRTGWAPAAVALFGLCGGHFIPLSPARLNDLDRQTLQLRWPEQKIVADAYTPHGHGVVLERNGQRALYEQGRLALVLGETQTAEELAHLALLQVAAPRRVLVLGALGGLLPEVLKHPVREVVVAEVDTVLTRLTRNAADPATRRAMDDPRVRIVYGDARRLIATGGLWDAVLLNGAEPATALANRCYTVEFFVQARAALRTGGVLAFPLPGAENYYGPELLARNGAIYRALDIAFPHVTATPLATNYCLASDQPLCLMPAELGRRLTQRRIATELVNAYYFDYLLSVDRIAELAVQYRTQPATNRDAAPIAYLHDALYRQRQQPGRLAGALAILADWQPIQMGAVLLALALVGAMLPAVPWRRRWPARWLVFSAVIAVGFVGMAGNILLLVLAQQLLGALYHLLGALTAVGMAGLALGAWDAPRRGWRGLPPWIALGIGIVLSLPAFANAAAGWPFALTLAVLAFAMLVLGLLVGRIFPLAVDAGLSPGVVYSADLLGAALAGALTGTLLLPAYGMVPIGIVLALLLLLPATAAFARPSRTW